MLGEPLNRAAGSACRAPAGKELEQAGEALELWDVGPGLSAASGPLGGLGAQERSG